MSVPSNSPRRRVPAGSPTFASLSPQRQRLVRLLETVGFGRVENLLVRGGEPVLDDPRLKVFREVKFGGENGPRPAPGPDEQLKDQVLELLACLKQLGDARIEVLTVKHGWPFSLHVQTRH